MFAISLPSHLPADSAFLRPLYAGTYPVLFPTICCLFLGPIRAYCIYLSRCHTTWPCFLTVGLPHEVSISYLIKVQDGDKVEDLIRIEGNRIRLRVVKSMRHGGECIDWLANKRRRERSEYSALGAVLNERKDAEPREASRRSYIFSSHSPSLSPFL